MVVPVLYGSTFSLSDARARLERLGLAGRDAGNHWQAYPLEQALVTLSGQYLRSHFLTTGQ
jgi:hypothetical protein